MEKQDILREEFSKFASKVIDTLGDFHEHMESTFEEIQQESKPEGIVIDHKTFSQLINTLSYGVSAGTVDKAFYEGMVKLGLEQSKPAEKEVPEDNEPTIKMLAFDGEGNPVQLSGDIWEMIGKHLNKNCNR